MFEKRILPAVAFAALTFGATAAMAQRGAHPSCNDGLGCGSLDRFTIDQVASWSCQDLFLARNAIYYAEGYCFKTDRAISTFGNDGCRWRNEGDVPLSGLERRNIDLIRRVERERGCR